MVDETDVKGDEEQQQLLKSALSCGGKDVDVAPLTALMQGKAENPAHAIEVSSEGSS